ncbi:MAG TPA: hypothetical protein VFJ29_06430 [Candidatus Kapabacteria bacterium]|nr:hypothetical protein [Candidatus Kapabacteria bacterium]
MLNYSFKNEQHRALRHIVIHPRMRRIFAFSLIVAAATVTQAQTKGIRTNLQMLDSCAQIITAATCAHFPQGHTDIYVDSTRDAFLISGKLFRAAHALEQGNNAPSAACKVHVLDAGVQYKKLGDQGLVRTARMQVAADLRDGAGRSLWSDALTAQVSDTVQCDDVASLESPNVAATRAPNPCTEDAGAFSSVLEPIILAAASATIVLLLFTVRSQ